ncbi:hypothetical protein DESC_590063 [Desulfosarcina cetonica]|nr:hypothetical protein DESC_590063 [Desulfosarcina cetonica]
MNRVTNINKTISSGLMGSFSFDGHVQAAHQFGRSLQKEQADARQHDGLEGVDQRLPVALHGTLLHLEREMDIRDQIDDDAQPQGQEENQIEYRIDDRPDPWPEAVVEDIDAHLAAIFQGKGLTQEKIGAAEHVAQVEGPFGRAVEQIAGDDLIAQHGGQRDHQVDRDAGGDLAEPVDRAAKSFQGFHQDAPIKPMGL